MTTLRNAEDTLVAAVEQAINSLDLTEKDAAAAQLARRYAAVIDQCDDQAWAMRWVAPGLLDSLEQLGGACCTSPGRQAEAHVGGNGEVRE